MMLFIPFPFSHMFGNGKEDIHAFPHTEVNHRYFLQRGEEADM
jgi:hypothetical protein